MLLEVGNKLRRCYGQPWLDCKLVYLILKTQESITIAEDEGIKPMYVDLL